MAKFHINPKTGNPGLCKAKTACPFGSLEHDHYGSKDEARIAYESSMASFSAPAANPFPLEKTILKDDKGEPLTIYHGSSHEFEAFDPSFTGQGNDSYGSGFYFSTVESVAGVYGKTRPFKVALTNPLLIDGYENMSLNEVWLDSAEVLEILSKHPDIDNQPDDSEGNPLADFSPDYWAKDHHSKEDINRLVVKMVDEYFKDGASFTNIEGIFGDRATEFRQVVHEATGWDGVVVKFREESDGQHVIAWFPEQIYAA